MIICVISSLYINLKPSYKIKVETIRDISLFDSDKEYFVYFGRPSCPNCIKFQRYINNNDYRLPKKIYYFNTDYWRKSGATNKICKEFNVKEVPSLIKIKSGKTVEKRDLSKFIENNISADRRFLLLNLRKGNKHSCI